MAEEEVLLKAREVAERLRVDTKTVYAWVKAGAVGHIRTPTGGVRIKGSEVDLMLAGKKVAGQTPDEIGA